MKKSMDPQMHTAEHILNQTMARTYGCGRCFSAHIERKKSKCDYHFDRNLSNDERRCLEDAVNGVIAADLTVSESVVDRREAARRFDLARLPEDAGEQIRIVSVGDYDHCPCVGPHVASTGAIGKFRITSTDQDDGVLRIRFKLERPR